MIAQYLKDLLNCEPGTAGPLECVHLHADRPPDQYKRIYDQLPISPNASGPPGRRVIISTNIAESCISIPGVKYVIDPGFSTPSVYNPRVRVTSTRVSAISKDGAERRAHAAGRGRSRVGRKCFRLYTESAFASELEARDNTEILISELSTTLLRMVKAGVSVSHTLPFQDDQHRFLTSQ
jgi:pre-mRNA-splicing factor ATP-dependent RNA helicase DHX15/PRP43